MVGTNACLVLANRHLLGNCIQPGVNNPFYYDHEIIDKKIDYMGKAESKLIKNVEWKVLSFGQFQLTGMIILTMFLKQWLLSRKYRSSFPNFKMRRE